MKEASLSLVIADSLFEPTILCVWNNRFNAWMLPGGMVEPGESPVEAQQRELFEETGLETVERRLVYRGSTPLTDSGQSSRAATLFIYRVDTVGKAEMREPWCPVEWFTMAQFLSGTPFRKFYTRLMPQVL
jgi:ADP-ribose pyrophosphatase YjhB (NUDIX family)